MTALAGLGRAAAGERPKDWQELLFRGSTQAQAQRRQIPILGYFAENGMGKTANMMRDLVPDIIAGVPLLSSVPIYDFRKPREGGGFEIYDNFQLFTHWGQLSDLRNGVLVLDEIGAIADSSSSLGEAVREELPQMRKQNDRVVYTAPDWSNAHLRLRQITQGIVVCRGYSQASDRYRRRRGEATDLPVMWRQNRLFSTRTISAIGREEFTKKQIIDAKSKATEWWWGPASPAFNMYDTLYRVQKVSEARCPHPECGLVLPDEPKCKGHDGVPGYKMREWVALSAGTEETEVDGTSHVHDAE